MNVTINDKSYDIQKLPLRRYPELLSVLQEVQKKTGEVTTGATTDQVLQRLPQIITLAFPEILKVIEITTTIPTTETEEMGLDDLIGILEAIMEVNRFVFVFETLKKMTARPSQIEQAK